GRNGHERGGRHRPRAAPAPRRRGGRPHGLAGCAAAAVARTAARWRAAGRSGVVPPVAAANGTGFRDRISWRGDDEAAQGKRARVAPIPRGSSEGSSNWMNSWTDPGKGRGARPAPPPAGAARMFAAPKPRYPATVSMDG